MTQINLSNCKSIGYNPFIGCSKLTSIHISPSNSTMQVVGDGIITDKPNQSIAYCAIGGISIAAGQSVTDSILTIRPGAFEQCQDLETADFPICTSIGDNAFMSCTALQSISFPLCQTLGSNAFAYCSSLASVNMSSCTSIGSYAFYKCIGISTASF